MELNQQYFVVHRGHFPIRFGTWILGPSREIFLQSDANVGQGFLAGCALRTATGEIVAPNGPTLVRLDQGNAIFHAKDINTESKSVKANEGSPTAQIGAHYLFTGAPPLAKAD